MHNFGSLHLRNLRIGVMAEPDRELVDAQVSIEPARDFTAETFILPGPQAEPGDTLRPLHSFEVNMPDLSYNSIGGVSPLETVPPGYSFHSVLDRHGHFREVEVLNSLSLSGAQEHFERRRGLKFRPARVDGTSCEIGMVTVDVPGQ